MQIFQPCSAVVWICFHCWIIMVIEHTTFN
jgi:hypothetical protein